MSSVLGPKDPVIGRVRDALRLVIDTLPRRTAGGGDAVDARDAAALAIVIEVEPSNGAGAEGPRVGTGRRRDLVGETGAEYKVRRGIGFGHARVEDGDAVGIEEVVADKRHGDARQVEAVGGWEGVVGGGAELGPVVAVEGQVVGPEGEGGQGVEVGFGGDGSAPL